MEGGGSEKRHKGVSRNKYRYVMLPPSLQRPMHQYGLIGSVVLPGGMEESFKTMMKVSWFWILKCWQVSNFTLDVDFFGVLTVEKVSK